MHTLGGFLSTEVPTHLTAPRQSDEHLYQPRCPPVIPLAMSFNSSSTKRPRSNSPDVSVPSAHSSRELPPPKRIRQYDAPSAHLTRLSDELFVRIASYLNTRDLASFQRVSRRCQRIAIDSQVWRVLFHRRFSPRSRLQRPSASSTAISSGPQDVGYQYTNWKGLYKLRHNWNAGSCGIREIDITTSELTSHPQTSSLSDDHSVEAQESSSASTSQLAPKPSTLVKLHEVCGSFLWDVSVVLRGGVIVIAN